ncbi:MAG: RHS repeat-associated core domain-containing protein [Chloroflexi bacterium]|nr:RHS repeat-associated core domain-containing protein [Chloroflexota bacterium]
MWERDIDNGVDTIQLSHAGRYVASYTKGPGTNTDLQFHFTDHLGSPVASGDPDVLAAGGGHRTLYNHWWPFGAPNWEAAPFDSGEINFTGQRHDAATGLGFYNARYYDSELGRFISTDSIVPGATRGDSFNRYAYVSNNPLRSTDPSGNIGDEAHDDVPFFGFAVGAKIDPAALLTDEGARQAAAVFAPAPGSNAQLVFIDSANGFNFVGGQSSFLLVESSGKFITGTLDVLKGDGTPTFGGERDSTVKVLDTGFDNISDVLTTPAAALSAGGASIDSGGGISFSAPTPREVVKTAKKAGRVARSTTLGFAAGKSLCGNKCAIAGGIAGFASSVFTETFGGSGNGFQSLHLRALFQGVVGRHIGKINENY